ncbi:ATP-binding cassette domain-containing protein [Candidatus Saccharibacteria bacterium]|nr:ATP-binding cassette domain-containing protein [Candidatus Saccharibacteria bacterium]
MLKLVDVDFGVRKGRSRTKILDHISLEIPKNSLTVITGPNGSGKSTLAEIIMGIKTPTSGKIVFNRSDITDKSITERAKLGIAFSFQQPVRFKGVNVYDLLNIANGELISKEEAGKYLKMVGLEPDKYLLREVNDKLSGGELKRIEIASILARKAQLLIFDEPEAGIDLWSFTDLTKVFKKLKGEGKTLIIISHQERILKIADEIIVLDAGRIIFRGKPDKVLPKIKGKKL